ncbi:Homeobox-like_domain superfamily [Hexamita inflata]|uniref:Homeobox-like domain superfamily n=1 Tax=Hexamita inflata TaxID=28002 RepID=A0AA86QQ52_9EUKA|nr:Homeobox-like domain superfamily [Hexamita inflata]
MSTFLKWQFENSRITAPCGLVSRQYFVVWLFENLKITDQITHAKLSLNTPRRRVISITSLFWRCHSVLQMSQNVSRRLSEEERKVLEYIWEVGPQVRRTKEYMARYMKVSIQSINHFIRRLKETGSCQVQRATNNCVVKYGAPELRLIADIVRANPYQTRTYFSKEFRRLTGRKISLSSLTRLLNQYGAQYNMYTDFEFAW